MAQEGGPCLRGQARLYTTSPSRLRRATTRVAAPSIRFVLKKHLRLAGHCPNNDSLFPPLAAVIIVAPKGRASRLAATL